MKKFAFMKDAMILFVITLVAGILLGFVYQITLQPIAAAKEATKKQAYKKVFPDASGFERLESDEDKARIQSVNDALLTKEFGKVSVKEVAIAKGGGDDLGYVITSSTMDGFGGEIVLAIGCDLQGKVNGAEFLTLAETPGLGMKAKEATFISQFSGKKVDAFEVVKSGQMSTNSVDAISGATITSKAVVNAVNAALLYVQMAGGK